MGRPKADLTEPGAKLRCEGGGPRTAKKPARFKSPSSAQYARCEKGSQAELKLF